MEIGELIRERRLAKKLTQKRLGEEMGFSGNQAQVIVAQWEAGTRPVHKDKLKLISKLLEIPLEDLLP